MDASPSGSSLEDLVREVHGWVAAQMSEWIPPSRLDAKVVRDPLHDFVRLEPHEVGLWDTPIVQRLRYIHQTALSYLVYPGLHHTRFEHSIGVLHVADRMIAAIEAQRTVDPLDRLHVRLAALLHDVGHVPFSHLGETAIEDGLPWLEDATSSGTYEGVDGFFSGVPFGEVLSYLIITSPAFQAAFHDQVAPLAGNAFGKSLRDIDLRRVAGMVIGRLPRNEAQWPVQIINGSFDADKLDYIMRDSYASGIKIEVDTTRLIHSVRVLGGDEGESLAVAGHAVNYLEQILLAKITMSTALYHHHKVRALECMMREFFRGLPADGPLPRPDSITAWLDLTEQQILVAGSGLAEPHTQVREITGRRLLKRCLVLDRNTIGSRDRASLQGLGMRLRRREELELFRDRLLADLPKTEAWSRRDIWIDFPKPPDVDREAQQCLVELAPGVVEPLSELMPADDWVRSYVANKLRGHVFYLADDSKRRVVAGRADSLLRGDNYRISVQPLAQQLALKT